MKPVLQLTDPSFQTQLAGKCDLHLELFPGGMYVAVVDKGQDQLKVLLSAESQVGNLAEMADYIQSESVLAYHFRKVKISLHTQKFTFIPDKLFDKELLGEYAKFIGADADDRIQTEHIRSAKCMVVFAVPGDVAQLMEARFHHPQFYPAAAASITAGTQWAKNAEGPMVMLNMLPQNFEVLVFNEGKFEFYNLFPNRTADEFNYFLLNLFDGLGLTPAQTEFILAGEVDTAAEERLQKYTANIRRADNQHFVNISETFEKVPATNFYAITALSLCE